MKAQNQAARPGPDQGALKPFTLAHKQGVLAMQPKVTEKDGERGGPLSADPSTIVVCSVGVWGS